MQANLEPIGFWSYTSLDDKLADGRLSQLRVILARDLQQRMGRQKVHIFQDVAAIRDGADWHDKIDDALARSSFLIPIVTPGFLASEMCCEEVMRFRQREMELGRKDLIFPFRYIDVSDIGPDECHAPEVLTLLKSRQWIEFEHLRYRDPRTEEVMAVLGALAGSIRAALRDVTRDEPPSEQPRQTDATPSRTPIGGAPATQAQTSRSETARPVSTPLPAQRVTAPDGPALPPKPAWAATMGTDTFGTWADIAVPAGRGTTVTQRLRLIPPGQFQMGSPQDDPDRYLAESPRHTVTIEDGFWLFDTPCTQAFWELVTVENPSRFKSPTLRSNACHSTIYYAFWHG